MPQVLRTSIADGDAGRSATKPMKTFIHGLVTIILALAGLNAWIAPTSACTGIRLTASDGTVIYARTMESALDFQSNLIIVPRGQPYVGTKAENTPGLRWSEKYAFVGPNVFGMPYIADGMNERGLALGHFVFTDFAKYQEPDPADLGRTIDCAEVGTYLLSACGNVSEAVAALRSVPASFRPAPLRGNGPCTPTTISFTMPTAAVPCSNTSPANSRSTRTRWGL